MTADVIRPHWLGLTEEQSAVHKDISHSRAFRDFEPLIRDVERMANIALEVAFPHLQTAGTDKALFAVTHQRPAAGDCGGPFIPTLWGQRPSAEAAQGAQIRQYQRLGVLEFVTLTLLIATSTHAA